MYQIGQFVEIEGPLDVDVLATAVARAVSETDALNMAFGEDSSGPFQYPHPNGSGMVVTDLSGTDDGGSRGGGTPADGAGNAGGAGNPGGSGSPAEAAARELMDADMGDAATLPPMSCCTPNSSRSPKPGISSTSASTT